MDITLFSRRDHWEATKTGSLFFTCRTPTNSMNPAAVFVELIQKLILPSPISREGIFIVTYFLILTGIFFFRNRIDWENVYLYHARNSSWNDF
jgi:hypothetical protein